MIALSAKASDHFTFGELTTTEVRAFLDEQRAAPKEIRFALVRLAADLLEPARELVGRLRVNSAYRCPGLNAYIGGSKTSAHMLGLAADVYPLDMDLLDAYLRIVRSGIVFDQAIYEYGRWIHLGAAPPGKEPRRERKMIFSPGVYEAFRADDPRVRQV